MKAWFKALWIKLRPGLVAAGVAILALLALFGLKKKPKGGTVEKDHTRDIDSVIDSIDANDRASVDAAREAGKRAGREALHRGRG